MSDALDSPRTVVATIDKISAECQPSAVRMTAVRVIAQPREQRFQRFGLAVDVSNQVQGAIGQWLDEQGHAATSRRLTSV